MRQSGQSGAIALFVAVVIGLAAPVLAQTPYTIQNLGLGAACTASAISDLGAVVGHCTRTGTGTLDEMAFTWQNGVRRNLGKMPDGLYSTAHAINERGVAVGEGDTGDYRLRPTLYRNGRVIEIDRSGLNARAIYVNDRGVIVGDDTKGSGPWTAVIWKEDASRPGRFRRIALPGYPGGDPASDHGYATGANERVQVVGWVQSTLFGQRGTFWNSDPAHTLTLLEPIPGAWTSIAWGVNGRGQVVGQSDPPFRARATPWLVDAARTPVDLGTLPGDADSTATAINDAGRIIGTSTSGRGITRAVLWGTARRSRSPRCSGRPAPTGSSSTSTVSTTWVRWWGSGSTGAGLAPS